jgi:pantoate--beta-alanine ligase
MASLGGPDVGFVPTMGAFHEGHLTLMRNARQRHESVCVSLFVNPLQFGRGEDLEMYPRNEERDFELATAAGVDTMFAPSAAELYTRESTLVRVPDITELWEGEVRPGHFDGVATVVAKLFNIVRPRIAYFGWKDIQQCLVIRRMVSDLNMQIGLDFHDTVRESDGLALSSRNAYLTPNDRSAAPLLHRALSRLSSILRGSQLTQELIDLNLTQTKADLRSNGFDVDYLELVNLDDMKKTRTAGPAALIVAARLGTTRLIDNERLDLP